MEARWYRKYPHDLGKVIGTQTEIAENIGINQSSFSRNIKSLRSKDKYLIIQRKRYLILGYFPLFLIDVARKIHSKSYATIHELYADINKTNAKLQENYAISQEEQTHKRLQRLNHSSKDDLSSSYISNSNNIEEEFGDFGKTEKREEDL